MCRSSRPRARAPLLTASAGEHSGGRLQPPTPRRHCGQPPPPMRGTDGGRQEFYFCATSRMATLRLPHGAAATRRQPGDALLALLSYFPTMTTSPVNLGPVGGGPSSTLAAAGITSAVGTRAATGVTSAAGMRAAALESPDTVAHGAVELRPVPMHTQMRPDQGGRSHRRQRERKERK